MSKINNPPYGLYQERNISFENKNGDVFFITANELREQLSNFIDLQFSSMTYVEIEQKKQRLKKELNKKLTEFEMSLKQHIEDKINKITLSVIDNVTSKVFEDKVKKEVKERLKKLEL